MLELLKALVMVEKHLSVEKGSFWLFGVFEREGANGKVDLVVGAEWLPADDPAARKSFYERLQREVPLEQLLLLAAAIVVRPSDLFVRELERIVLYEQGTPRTFVTIAPPEETWTYTEFRNCVINGMEFRRILLLSFDLSLSERNAPATVAA